MDVHPAAAPATRPALPAARNRSGAVEPPGPPDRSRSGPGRAVPDQAIPPARWTRREEPGAGPPQLSRREFVRRLGLGAAAIAIPGCSEIQSPLGPGFSPADEPALPAGKDPEAFIRHSPLELETRREAFGTSGIVPYERLFVRSNLPTPDASGVDDRDGWQLAVEGVGNPRTLTLRELKTLGVETVAAVLQCSGNGRIFFPHGARGAQWGVGAAGCVVWSGVPVRSVAEALGGVDPGARFTTGTGGEAIPAGLDRDDAVVERSVPLEKGMEDALLAWEMNGEPLPLAHGGPLRLIVPGYFGINQVKYLARLAFTRTESNAAIMRTGYRFRAVGEEGDPGQPTMWEMGVKSWINHPSAEGATVRRAGPVVVHGVAFGGTRAVRRVEVSVNGGRSWEEARLVGPDLGPYAWRPFAVAMTLPAGRHLLASRATDVAGNTQPAERVENQRGYANTSWRDHAVMLTLS